MRTPRARHKVDITPEHRAWISLVTDAVAAFTKDLVGDDDQIYAMNAFYIHSAAVAIWDATRGHPCWSQLDVDAFMERWSTSPFWSAADQAAVVATLVMFYNWLADTKRVTRAKVQRVVRAFGHHFNEEMLRMLFAHHPGPKHVSAEALN